MKVYLLITGLCIFSFIGTYLIKTFALKKEIFSIPNSRSLHSEPTPHGGGLAIVVSWYIGISVLFFWGLIDKSLFFALLCGILLAIISLLDDLKDIKPIIRLLVQFISVIGAFYFLKGLHLNLFPELKVDYRFYIYPLAVIGMIWFINLFNFMDGADGFASFETIIISLALFFFSGDVVNIILIACVSGFLYWNWPKAKIFMGDIGSTQLGFILIVLGIHFHNFNKFSILNWIMLSSPFWFDATYTLFRRWRNKEELSEAHRNHAYQRAIRGGFSHLKVNLCLLLIDLSVFIMILIYRKIELLRLPILIFTLISLFAITKIIDKKVPFR